jgi:hypothetical protein
MSTKRARIKEWEQVERSASEAAHIDHSSLRDGESKTAL